MGAISGGIIGGMAGAQMGSAIGGMSGPMPQSLAIGILVMIAISCVGGYALYRKERDGILGKYEEMVCYGLAGFSMSFLAQSFVIGIFFLIKAALGF